jgi:hypothetical protein
MHRKHSQEATLKEKGCCSTWVDPESLGWGLGGQDRAGPYV